MVLNDQSPIDDPADRFDDLIQAFAEEIRNGKSPTIKEYAEKHPEYADKIEDLFPAIELVESLADKQSRDRNNTQAQIQFLRKAVDQIGDFRVIREIGRGGMGVVFEAQQESLDRRVALKVLPSYFPSGGDSVGLQRFKREANSAASLHHSNIVPVFGVGQHDGLYYYVMQYIESVGLDEILKKIRSFKDGPVPSLGEIASSILEDRANDPLARVDSSLAENKAANEEAGLPSSSVNEAFGEATDDGNAILDSKYWRNVATVGVQIANALSHAHENGVLHRDIKPSNILIDANGTPWIADFGLAKDKDDASVTKTGDIVGTLQYMAPEQLNGEYDSRSDVYGLGATLFELLCLKPLLRQDDVPHMIQQIVQRGSPPTLRKINPALPRDLETIVARATAPDRDRRYLSAKELVDDLERFLDDRPIFARRATRIEKAWRWCRRNPAVAALSFTSLGLLCLTAAVASIGFFSEAKQRKRAEQTLEISLESLDKVYRRFAPERTVVPTVQDDLGFQISSQPTLSKETADLLLDILPAYHRFAEQGSNRLALQKESAVAYRRVGEIQFQLGRKQEALTAFEKAGAKYRQITLETGTDVKYERARILNEMGVVYGALNFFPEAEKRHLDALALLETAPMPIATNEGKQRNFEMARTQFYLGRRPPLVGFPSPQTDRQLGEHTNSNREISSESRNRIDKAIELLKELRELAPNVPEYTFLLALCKREVSIDVDSREFGESTALLERLCERHPGNPIYLIELSENLSEVDIRSYDGSKPNAKEVEIRLRTSVEIAEELIFDHPNIPRHINVLAINSHKAAEIVFRNHNYERRSYRFAATPLVDARMFADLALKSQERLVAMSPSVHEHRMGLARMKRSLAEIMMVQDELSKASETVDSSINDLLYFIGTESESPWIDVAKASAEKHYQLAARLAARRGKFQQSEKMEAEARRIRAELFGN